MAAAIVQRTNGASTTPSHLSNSSSLAITAFGSSVTAGNGIVCVIWGWSSTLPSITNIRDNKDGTTNFSVAVSVHQSSTGGYVLTYYLPNTAGGASEAVTATFGGSISEIYGIAFECSGVPTDATFFDTSTTNTGTSTTPSTGTITAGANAGLAFSALGYDEQANVPAITFGNTSSGWTVAAVRPDPQTDFPGLIDFKAASLSGSISDSWSITSGSGGIVWEACVSTFNASAAAAFVIPHMDAGQMSEVGTCI